ncbi:MAG: hypothetical protein V5B38_01060 [Candidatus Accumulibacter propinquus]
MTILNGTTGNDTLNGSLGGNVNDVLNGGLGDDLYQYTLGSGNDVINDTGGIDTIQLGDPLHLFTSWYFYRIGNDLVMDFNGQGRVTVTGQFLLGLPIVEVLGFSDGGSPYTFSNSLTGSAGNNALIGTLSAETITGDSGNDLIFGNEGNDTLYGGNGDDELHGGAANNVLDGGAGSDSLNGGAGADTMLGGDGTDSYCVDHAGDLVSESNGSLATGGNDVVYSYLAAYTLTTNVERLRLMLAGASTGTGNALDNTLYAGDGNNVLDGAAGNDTVSYAFAAAGVTVSLASAGAQATGGSGSDTLISIENLIGSGFNDSLVGNTANNVLDGGAGSDFLNGATGADTMIGGDGTDSYCVDHAGDLVSESNGSLATGGNDIAYSYVSAYTLTANVERLRLMLAGASTGTGNALDNTLYAGDGNNVLDGAAGNDTVSYAFAAAGVTVSLASAGAQATGGSGSDTLISIENLIGSGFNDSLIGNTANNVLDGGAGSDFLNGATGADTMIGGDGTDAYCVDHAGDLVTENNSSLTTGGNDVVYSYLAAYTLTANVERLRLMLAGASTGTGNALDNTLYAGDGNNVLNGAAGNDTVSYAFAAAGVTVSLASAGAQATGGSGSDTLISIENLIGSGFNDSLVGNTANNVLDGGAGSDFLNGATGADTMIGGDGTDSYCVDHAGDLVSESNGSLATGGNDIAYSYVSAYTLTANVERLRLMLAGASTGTGNALDNTLYAGDGNNVLDGAAGNDTVSYAFAAAGVTVSLASAGAQATGGSGSDTLISIENLIGSGFNDSLIGNTANNVLDGGAGSDFLNGATGADTMLGGDGTDAYCVDHAGDLVSESNGSLASGGNDIVYSYLSAYTLTTNVERLRLMLAGASNGTGNALDNTLYAGDGNNVLDGATGNDTVSYAFATAGVTLNLATAGAQATGGSGSDMLISIENLIGSGFNDNLSGNTANNILDGGAGSDFLNGGVGADTMLGGDATDAYCVDHAGDLVNESNGSLATGGNDIVYSYLAAYTLTANVERLRLMLAGASNATGNALDNILYAGDGDNVLDGAGGTDTVSYAFAGAGVTVSLLTAGAQATGGFGSDTLISIENLTGSGFNDALTGNAGNNVLDGGAGNDTLNGGTGADTMLGGDGSDLYTVDDAGDVVMETNAAATGGIDTVNALVDHTLGANVENLNLIAAGAVNGTGNTLDNLIYAGAGDNVIDGAGGTDTVSYAFAGAGVTVSLATAGAQATGGSGSDTLISIENLTGSGFNDALTGNAGNNVLDGGAGNDTLNGGTGADTMLGGDGSDLYTVEHSGDVVTETNAAAAGGIDTVNALVDHTLGANVENLNLIAAGAVNGTGNTLDNLIYAGAGDNVLDGAGGTDTVSYALAGAGVTVSLATAGAQATGGSGSDTLISIENLTGSGFNDALTGNAGNNVLDGGAGNDTLNGGTGADTMLGGDGSDLYTVDHAGDVVTETNAAAAGGIDTVNALVDHILGANVENLSFIAAGAVNGTGNTLDNLIYAGAGNNVIDGAGGTDTVSYALAGAGVTVSLATAGAQVSGGSGSDTLISIENLTGSSFNDALTGNAGNNVLDGGAGNDTLNGGTGADTMLGGDGSDLYTVDHAGDVVTETNATEAGGIDTVNALVDQTLGAHVENLNLIAAGAVNGTGNALDNILYAGDGDNVLDGAGGTDTVSYAFAGAGVTVSLLTAGAQATGGSGSDTLISIENLTGSGFNDNLTGNADNNVIDGGGGTDTVSYAFAGAGVTVSLATAGAQATGSSGSDTLISIENLTGSGFNDNLTGNTGNNVFDSGVGNDTLIGDTGNDTLDGGAGSDIIDGGSGDDRVVFRPSAAGVSDTDDYKGNVGSDTLSLELTHAELNSAEVQADLRAYEEFLRLNANVATATGAEFQFTAFALKASGLEHLEVTDTDGMIWRNGTAGVTIGSADAPASFNIGANVATPAGDIWTGALPSGNHNWNVPEYWQDASVPTNTDIILFNASDPGGHSVVDPTFQGTIAGLIDAGEAAHILEFQRTLQVNGPVSVHAANSESTGALSVLDTQLTLHLTDFNVGSGTARAYLLFNSGAVIDARDVDVLSVGHSTDSAAANGSLTLASNSALHLGTSAIQATLNLGYSDSGSAIGVLDVLAESAVLDLHLSELNVGRGSYYYIDHGSYLGSIGTGILKWNQTEIIRASNVYFGRGSATGILEVPTGGKFHLGTDSERIANLRIAFNDSLEGTATANLDFSVNNPTFTAFVSDDLSIGHETGATFFDVMFSTTAANGSLTLGSNSTLHLGTAAAQATLNIGWSERGWGDGNATGVLDALAESTVLDLHLSELNVGRGNANGFGTGTLKWNQTEIIRASNVYFGRGSGTGILDVPTGGKFCLGTDTERIANLRIAYNDNHAFSLTGVGASANLDFSVSNPTFTAFVSDDLSIGCNSGNATPSWASGSLTLASNSTLHLGTAAALATLNIGCSQGFGSATGVLDALAESAVLDLHLSELNVGYGISQYNIGTGTLKWNQTEVISASNVYFGRGCATGNLEVADGGEFHLGTESEQIANLRIAYNDATNDTSTANLDFSETNPTFTAFVSGDLSIGRETGAAKYTDTAANGSMTLASNSALHLGTSASPGTLNIGWSQNGNYYGNGKATGVLNAAEGTLTAHLTENNIGVTAGAGKAMGIFVMGNGNTSDVQTMNIGIGTGATGIVDILGGSLHAATLALVSGALDLNANPLTVGATSPLHAQTLDLMGGLLTGGAVSITDGTFNFSDGVLSVDTFTGLLNQNGGVLSTGDSVGQSTLNGNYDLASAGSVKIRIFGSTFNSSTKQYDGLLVNGTVNLNGDNNPGGGGTLDVDLGYSPSVGSSFTILANDGTDAVSGWFNGLLEGASFNTAYGSQTVTFQISYSGGTGNDVVLTVTGKTGAAPTGLTVDGAADNDLLSGSVGADTFTGFAGNDIFTGGAGNDLFIFDVGCGFDRINDFSPSSDDIQLSLALATNFAALDSNGNSVLDAADANVIVAGNDTILLFGNDLIEIVGQTALHSADFVFV